MTAQEPKPDTAQNTRQNIQWNNQLLLNPHEVADKRQRVKNMFAAIAPSYDLNNRLHSLWMDQHWRRTAVKIAQLKPNDQVVDVACGTGDLTICFADGLRKLASAKGTAREIIGVDFTYEMLPIAAKKKHAHDPAAPVRFINGDAQNLSLPDACADVVSIAFGIRNVQDISKALSEFHRILKPGGRVIILEFSLPSNPILRGLYNFYFKKILPNTATLISGDKTGAYKYLPSSVNTFIDRQQMVELMEKAGFSNVQLTAMTFGVCICYRGEMST